MSAATDAFLAMLAAERGAAANTLAAYARDLAGAEEAVGDLAAADRDAVASLAGEWASPAPARGAQANGQELVPAIALRPLAGAHGQRYAGRLMR